MITKQFLGITLWAVPRFHRAPAAVPAKGSALPSADAKLAEDDDAAQPASPAGVDGRLQTYSFMLEPLPEAADEALEQPQTCH